MEIHQHEICTIPKSLQNFIDTGSTSYILDGSVYRQSVELESFRSSLKLMFQWKSRLIDLNNKILLANFNREEEFKLTDVSSSISPRRSPVHHVTPAQVYLSPAKRTYSTFKGL
ncbi:hypothetical protein HPULCUR_002251 [Helicostylum pulchrum]|uniref:Uncharacterized protein n=1 Tax=Helicostylum pulchrum TaxID=562976 RepID=A0ABP9XQ45_9FUNG